MLKVKVTAIGNSIGIILPREAVSRLKASKGDILCLVEVPEGFTLIPYQPDLESQINTAKKVMQNYRNALQQLAK